ncbi:extensin [Streptomyces sp. NPDC054804]
MQRAASPGAALPVKPNTTAAPTHPVPLRAATPISATAPLPVAPLNRPTVQRDALPTTTVKETPVTSARAERQPPPPTDPPPSYSGTSSGSGSGSSSDSSPPGYSAVEEGGFDPRALTEFQVDALVHRIIDRVTRHVRTELRRDRERVGKLRDFRS